MYPQSLLQSATPSQCDGQSMMIAAPYYLIAILGAFTLVIGYAALTENWYWKGYKDGKQFEQNHPSKRVTQ
jgi:hypothetical protein